MRPLPAGFAAFLILLALGVPPAARGSDARAVRDTLARDLPFQAGGRLTIDTTRGDIRVTAWNRDVVEVRAERSADRADDLDLVPIEIRSAADEINIASRVPPYAGRTRVRVDYRLKVPSRVDLKTLATTIGDVAVSGVNGRIVVRVENGAVAVTASSGLLDLVTGNGQIEADPTEIAGDAIVRLETYNGDILLAVPASARDARFELRTLNGTIHSDIPFDIRHNFGPQWVHVESSRGPLVCAYSANGDIKVRRR